MKVAQLKPLLELAQKAKDRDMAIFANAKSKRESIEAEMQKIRGTGRLDGASDFTNLGASLSWQAWSDKKLAELRSSEQAARTEEDRLREIARKTAAKVEAIKFLIAKSSAIELRDDRRRAEQESRPPDA